MKTEKCEKQNKKFRMMTIHEKKSNLTKSLSTLQKNIENFDNLIDLPIILQNMQGKYKVKSQNYDSTLNNYELL